MWFIILDVNGCKVNDRLGIETLSTENVSLKINIYWTFANRILINCLPIFERMVFEKNMFMFQKYNLFLTNYTITSNCTY